MNGLPGRVKEGDEEAGCAKSPCTARARAAGVRWGKPSVAGAVGSATLASHFGASLEDHGPNVVL